MSFFFNLQIRHFKMLTFKRKNKFCYWYENPRLAIGMKIQVLVLEWKKNLLLVWKPRFTYWYENPRFAICRKTHFYYCTPRRELDISFWLFLTSRDRFRKSFSAAVQNGKNRWKTMIFLIFWSDKSIYTNPPPHRAVITLANCGRRLSWD